MLSLMNENIDPSIQTRLQKVIDICDSVDGYEPVLFSSIFLSLSIRALPFLLLPAHAND